MSLDRNTILHLPAPEIDLSTTYQADPHIRNDSIGNINPNNSPLSINIIIPNIVNQDSISLMDFDPHVFLYRLHPRKLRKNEPLIVVKKSGWMHPCNAGGAMFSNISGNTRNTPQGTVPVDSEWAITPTSIHPHNTRVPIQIDPRLWYGARTSTCGGNLFPTDYDTWMGSGKYSKNMASGAQIEHRNHDRSLIFAFKLVIRDPENPNRPLMSDLSKKLIITPKLGQFLEGRYFYGYRCLVA
jgi:hypothetical protein